MALFKCKMCGGALEIGEGESVAVCEYCGTRQTPPRLDDDRRANLYDRANHFRRNNEFDKAMGIYEQILNDDITDAEAYWSLVLCRFGIEYVEDPVSHKRVPTVNRAQLTSVFDDDNYKSALQYADSAQRSIYEAEAKAINVLQKNILAISQREEPFDVFICYKETDKNGRRTVDSVLAQELYYGLKNEGFKTFFSRITLEDKLGSAYEPYIFAALNSARVMVVLGTCPEHFNAVWVRNEWSRYLTLIKQGQNKMLIPAYKDMDPYELPEEFSHLQAQDMGKLGFMQDLIRGIKKLVQGSEARTSEIKENVVSEGGVNVAPLLKRAFMFLEDGDWSLADEYCEKVLDLDPENGRAYLGKLMAELNVRRQEGLKELELPFDDSSNYKKVVRFADDGLKSEIIGYIEHIIVRNENALLESLYVTANDNMREAQTSQDYELAAERFDKLEDYKDSTALAAACRENAEIARKDELLAIAKRAMQENTVGGYRTAIKRLESLGGWRDADECLSVCKKELAELEAREKLEREKAERKEKRNRRIAIIAPLAVLAAFLTYIIAINFIVPRVEYSRAVRLMEDGRYQEAADAFEALDGYGDNETQIKECRYLYALQLMEDEDFEEALSTFALISDYKDSDERGGLIRLRFLKNELPSLKQFGSVSLGAYEQDNVYTDGKEEIEWIVLEIDKAERKVLLLSKYVLDCKAYDSSGFKVTWAECSLRKWLNGEFFNSAFSQMEQSIIAETATTVKASDIETNDKVFMLSNEETRAYFEQQKDRVCTSTAYAYANGSTEGKARWYLRDVDYFGRVTVVNENGALTNTGYKSASYGVRPAIWVDIDALPE